MPHGDPASAPQPETQVFCQLPRRSLTPVIAAAFPQWCENLRTRNPARGAFTDPSKRACGRATTRLDELQDPAAPLLRLSGGQAATRSVGRSMFRVPVGVTGDAGRQRRHLSAKAAWKQEEPVTKKAAQLPFSSRAAGRRARRVSRHGGCVRMDSRGRALACASHDIIVTSPHEACWTVRLLLIKLECLRSKSPPPPSISPLSSRMRGSPAHTEPSPCQPCAFMRFAR